MNKSPVSVRARSFDNVVTVRHGQDSVGLVECFHTSERHLLNQRHFDMKNQCTAQITLAFKVYRG